LDQFNNLLIYVLLAAAVLALLIGHGIDAAWSSSPSSSSTPPSASSRRARPRTRWRPFASLIDPEATVRRAVAG
jgi:hypothetical protein